MVLKLSKTAVYTLCKERCLILSFQSLKKENEKEEKLNYTEETKLVNLSWFIKLDKKEGMRAMLKSYFKKLVNKSFKMPFTFFSSIMKENVAVVPVSPVSPGLTSLSNLIQG